MPVVSPTQDELDSFVSDGICYIYNPATLDCDKPPSENQHHLSSDMWYTRGEMR